MSDKKHPYPPDALDVMFVAQGAFMDILKKHRNFPEFPVNISSKDGQKVVKSVSHDCMHELFEAIHLLKNSKDHRKTDINEFDRESFLEELSDALHYFIEICILCDIDQADLYDAFMKKHDINVKRIEEGY